MRMPLVCAYCSGGMSIIVFSTLSFPGPDAARSSCEALLRRTGIVTNTALCTAPALQRTAPQRLRAALRPGNEQRCNCRRKFFSDSLSTSPLHGVMIAPVLLHQGALAIVTDAGRDAVDAAASGAEEGC